ncbi:MAG TPA: hypothetical protein VES19_12645 [Candidatus Limnocylindrales bacterium]|nr:hypothetical protein [Candidatus Limnocylindrales bacterium]
MFSNAMTTTARRSPTVDEIERRYLALHEGDREAAARNLTVDLIMTEMRDPAGPPEPGPATTRRLRRAAVMACGVFRLPMPHAVTVYDDTVEHAVRRAMPGPLDFGGAPISRSEAAALTTRRAAWSPSAGHPAP